MNSSSETVPWSICFREPFLSGISDEDLRGIGIHNSTESSFPRLESYQEQHSPEEPPLIYGFDSQCNVSLCQRGYRKYRPCSGITFPDSCSIFSSFYSGLR